MCVRRRRGRRGKHAASGAPNLVDYVTAVTASVVAFVTVEFKRLKRPSRRWAAVAGVLAGLGVGTLASAHWTASGAGRVTGTSGTTLALTLAPATPTATLSPGGQTDVKLTIANPNTLAVRVGSLSLDTTQGGATGFAVDAGHAGCAVASLSFTSQNNAGAGWTVPPTVGPATYSLSVTLTNALAMNANAAQACQGAVFTVYLAAA